MNFILFFFNEPLLLLFFSLWMYIFFTYPFGDEQLMDGDFSIYRQYEYKSFKVFSNSFLLLFVVFIIR